ncbi:hypothetical protein L7F22_043775 [Adiantum nelumboides]|nr:hypothetical protein [Adiantum nelumboides]
MAPGTINQTSQDTQPVSVTKLGNEVQKTLADAISTICEIDIDTMDSSYADRIKGKPCDMTSNQFLMAAMLCDEANKEIVDGVIAELGNQGWKVVFCKIAALFCKRTLPFIRGRVLVQVSPRGAYDYEDTLSWAKEYAKAFEQVGISKDRYAIKIPTTGPAMNAAKQLESDGISTLGTALFSVAQAIAAGQANCYAISPYYNEIKAHGDPSLRLNVEDFLTQHPMSNRIAQIRHVYNLESEQTGKKQPQMKPASFVVWQEAMACAMLGSENVTALPPVLDELTTISSSALQRDPKSDISKEVEVLLNNDPLICSTSFTKADLPTFKTDYLANNGAALDTANEADPITKQRLFDALELFCSFEDQCKTFIEEKLVAV